MTYKFSSTLIEGIIIARKNRFLMRVNINDDEHWCHCPTTGRIGNIELAGRPCLLSLSNDLTRKTHYTVEAVALNRPEDKDKTWIGINQNASNRYVEYYLKNGCFDKMIRTHDCVLREQMLGKSKLDFLVDDTYIEIKTPLQNLQLQVPAYIRTKNVSLFSSTDRLVRHVTELKCSLQKHQRAIMLLVFLYDNPGFMVIEHSVNYEQVRKVTMESFSAGVELWQANFEITKNEVSLLRYFQMDPASITQ